MRDSVPGRGGTRICKMDIIGWHPENSSSQKLGRASHLARILFQIIVSHMFVWHGKVLKRIQQTQLLITRYCVTLHIH